MSLLSLLCFRLLPAKEILTTCLEKLSVSSAFASDLSSCGGNGASFADLEADEKSLKRKIGQLEREHNVPNRSEALSALNLYVRTQRYHNTSTLGLDSARLRTSWKEVYSRFGQEYRQLPPLAKAEWEEKAKKERDRYKKRKDLWDRLYCDSDVARELAEHKFELARTRRQMNKIRKEDIL